MKIRPGTSIGIVVSEEQLGDAWRELLIERNRGFDHIIYVEFGFAEEVIGMIHYMDGTYEVGIGESLRPYDLLYEGTDLEEATESFLKAVRRHAWYD